ncbi:MAG: hypothetical protein WKF91_06310 [Segetibacter sp.]
MKLNKSLQYSRWEYIVPILGTASLLIACINISAKKYFWNDELYSYYLISEPSFSRMIMAFHDKINNTPILYFLTGWLWDKLFGSTELSYRLYSSLGMCVALVAVWATLRRTYGFWSTSIGTLGIFCTSWLILYQNADARMYGLFLALCALAFQTYDYLCRQEDPSYRLLFLNGCIHAAIVHTHLFGVFYSGAVLLCLLLTDIYLRRLKLNTYLSIVLSWLTISLYIPSFVNQSDAGNPRTWLPVPAGDDLIRLMDPSYSPFLQVTIVGIIVVISALTSLYKNVDSRSSTVLREDYPDRQSEVSVLIFACSFMIIPVVVFIISRTIKPIFLDRYLIPSALGYAVLLTYMSSRLISIPAPAILLNRTLGKKRRIAGFSLVAAGLLVIGLLLREPIQTAKYYPLQKVPGHLDGTLGFTNLPMILRNSHEFLQREFYSPTRERYFFILDWEAASDIRSGAWAPQEFKHLTALKRNFPQRFKNVQATEDFLGKYDRFLVMTYSDTLRKCPLVPFGMSTATFAQNLHCPQWVTMRLLHNIAYKVTTVGTIENNPVLLVEKLKAMHSSGK